MNFKRVRNTARPENHRSGRALDGLAAYRSGDFAIDDVEGLVLAVVNMGGWRISFSSDRLDERKPSVSVITGRQKCEQPAGVSDRVLERLATAAKWGKQLNLRAQWCWHDGLRFERRLRPSSARSCLEFSCEATGRYALYHQLGAKA